MGTALLATMGSMTAGRDDVAARAYDKCMGVVWGSGMEGDEAEGAGARAGAGAGAGCAGGSARELAADPVRFVKALGRSPAGRAAARRRLRDVVEGGVA